MTIYWWILLFAIYFNSARKCIADVTPRSGQLRPADFSTPSPTPPICSKSFQQTEKATDEQANKQTNKRLSSVNTTKRAARDGAGLACLVEGNKININIGGKVARFYLAFQFRDTLWHILQILKKKVRYPGERFCAPPLFCALIYFQIKF